MITLEFLKQHLGLQPLPDEGGFFAETYRASLKITSSNLSSRYIGDRAISTAIFYLITPESYSSLHAVASDELWHFYLGDPVEMLQLHPDRTGQTFMLGHDIENGMRLQLCVPALTWQGSRLAEGGKWALMGTTVAPGFEFSDFTTAVRDQLLSEYPAFKEQIMRLTPDHSPNLA